MKRNFEESADNCVRCVSFSIVVSSEKATNPKNTYEDWEFIMAFCDRVNADLEG